MQILRGTLLHKKSFTSKKGNTIPVISVLDASENFTKVIDITDFDNEAASYNVGDEIELAFRSTANVSERRRTTRAD